MSSNKNYARSIDIQRWNCGSHKYEAYDDIERWRVSLRWTVMRKGDKFYLVQRLFPGDPEWGDAKGDERKRERVDREIAKNVALMLIKDPKSVQLPK